MVYTVATVKDIDYYNKEEVKQGANKNCKILISELDSYFVNRDCIADKNPIYKNSYGNIVYYKSIPALTDYLRERFNASDSNYIFINPFFYEDGIFFEIFNDYNHFKKFHSGE